MSYTCMKPMKVQNLQTGKVDNRKPGDPVPEAASWPNPAVWVKRGFIQPDDAMTAQECGYVRGRLQPARASTEEDIRRGNSSTVPKLNEPLPGHAAGGAPADDHGDASPRTELLKLSRSDMEASAKAHGLSSPESYSNKGLLADAILEAAGYTDDTAGDDDGSGEAEGDDAPDDNLIIE